MTTKETGTKKEKGKLICTCRPKPWHWLLSFSSHFLCCDVCFTNGLGEVFQLFSWTDSQYICESLRIEGEILVDLENVVMQFIWIFMAGIYCCSKHCSKIIIRQNNYFRRPFEMNVFAEFKSAKRERRFFSCFVS